MTELLQDTGGSTPRPPAIVAGEQSHTHVLAPTDDGSSGPADVGFPINFFGKFYTQLFINTNGNVTFGEPLYKYLPFEPKTALPPIIAPFLADADTRAQGSGRIGYGTVMFEGAVAFCVNWISIGYHRERTDKRNSFQLLLVDRNDTGLGNFDIVMNYDRVEWESGISANGLGGLGGQVAAAGFSAGTGEADTFYIFEGSQTPGALLDDNDDTGLSQTSHNSPVKGRHIFRMRGGRIDKPTGIRQPYDKGILNEPRAVTLKTGRVLALGEYRALADVFHPHEGTWTPTQPPLSVRRGHTATLLPDARGRVLVTGGDGADFTSAELYDPATNAWTKAKNMGGKRFRHAAVLLKKPAQVMVIGGADSRLDSAKAQASAELYAPNDTWTPLASMSTARSGHTATVLDDGKVLVTGGTNGSTRLASAELYDPATDSWRTLPSMSIARHEHTATLLPGGWVLVVGGEDDGEEAAKTHGTAELFIPGSEVWIPTGNLKEPRRWHTATLLQTGHVLVTGGYHGMTRLMNSVELYDPGAMRWSSLAPMGADRYYHAAALLQDGRVLIVGGYSNTGQGTYELYTPPPVRS